ncbi:MAG: putative bicarbonate transporter, IctB family [Candidatus Accumulibacter adjunctus]|uniref:Bicarbonate transporter, IctB family n=1 Tax=Candidatus Accumulibacter adjunctus TaxID=1454001 RepID=A0A011NI16_9PROT|nr:MAG: putative bicarbonate transporter, IctB family [Candidatus Accumulibacter adjunctus]
MALAGFYALDFVRTGGDPRVAQLAVKQLLGCAVFLYFASVDLSPTAFVRALATLSSMIVGFYVYNSLVVLGSPYLANHLQEVTQEGRNQLGMYLAAMTTVLLFSLIVERRRVARYLLIGPAFILHGTALAYCMSRGAWIAFAVSATVGMIGFRRGRGPLILLGVASASVVGIVVLSKGLPVGVLGDAMEALGERYQTLLAVQDSASESSVGLRWSLLASALEEYSSSPLLGIGTEQFLSRHQYVTHNSYLQLLVENGIVGLLLFLVPQGVVIAVLIRLLKQSRQTGSEASRLPYGLGAVAVFVEMLFLNVLSGPLYFVFVGLAVNSWLGSVACSRGGGSSGGQSERAGGRIRDTDAAISRQGFWGFRRTG